MLDAERTTPLRRGWTTGACASGAARAAFEALLTGAFPDPVPVALPKGLRPEFALATHELRPDFARAGIVKDAGDDPDVTHGALIVATVRLARPGAGLSFKAGEGVGTVTRPGLPLPPGEPAINPAPRADDPRQSRGGGGAASALGVDATVETSTPAARNIAERTANGRLGIVGGLSILGTTGVVTPYSVLGLDLLDHERGGRRASERLRPYRRRDRGNVRGRYPCALWPARSCADRHGRFRRRPA